VLANTYRSRRDALRPVAKDGALLFVANQLSPRGYLANAYPYRQSSHLLYLSGSVRHDVALLMSSEGDTLFGVPASMDDIIWTGPQPSLEDVAAAAGIDNVRPVTELGGVLADVGRDGVVQYLPPYRDRIIRWLGELLGLDAASVRAGASLPLVRAMVEQRSHKNDDEVAEIEEALGVTARMFDAAMRATRVGARESTVAAAAQAIALAEERAQAYLPIVTVHGEVLHNETQSATLEENQILLMDAGAESARFYASDITRAWPVRGRFDDRQRGVYEVVLRAQQAAIDAIQPDVAYRDIHLGAARVIAEGLTDLGVMRGSPEDAVAAGAHALFFPHGLGHMLGIDVHDMEDLGEENVGYAADQTRSEQFGLSALRLARPLEPGFVVTVEPGVYFIPGLIDKWEAEGEQSEFLDYAAIEKMRDLGGIRIEDDVLVTEEGCRVLGPLVPKTVDEVEAVLVG